MKITRKKSHRQDLREEEDQLQMKPLWVEAEEDLLQLHRKRSQKKRKTWMKLLSRDLSEEEDQIQMQTHREDQ